MPFDIALGYLKAWIAQDPDWDWRTLTFAEYEAMFRRSVEAFSAIAADDSDLSQFRDCGGKIIISHGSCDQVIPAAGTIDYYDRVIEAMGSLEETRSFARMLICDGDGHGVCLDPGPGLTVADALVALMKWVEEGDAPEQIVGKTYDMASHAVKATRPVYAYPMVTRYSGSGDPAAASSYVPVKVVRGALEEA
jgi:feruloyl esterase